MGGGGAERDMVGLKRKGGVSRVWRGGGVWGLGFGVWGFGVWTGTSAERSA